MDIKEIFQAADALTKWFNSQNISPSECVPIMMVVTAYVICTRPNVNEKDKKEGLKIACGMLKELIK